MFNVHFKENVVTVKTWMSYCILSVAMAANQVSCVAVLRVQYVTYCGPTQMIAVVGASHRVALATRSVRTSRRLSTTVMDWRLSRVHTSLSWRFSVSFCSDALHAFDYRYTEYLIQICIRLNNVVTWIFVFEYKFELWNDDSSVWALALMTNSCWIHYSSLHYIVVKFSWKSGYFSQQWS